MGHLRNRSDELREAVAVGLGAVFADVEGGSDSTGNASSIKTTYNDHDQPTETQAYDADGHLLSRLVRTYDGKGRISDLKAIIEDPTSLFPAKEQAQMMAQSGLPPDEIRAHLKKVFSALMGESRKPYAYDSQGRITEVILHQGLFGGKVARKYTYNDHGDIAEECTTFTKSSSSLPVGVTFRADESGNLFPVTPPSEWPPQPDLPEPSKVHYTYQYDSYGNWTDKTYRGEGSNFTTHRELTYY